MVNTFKKHVKNFLNYEPLDATIKARQIAESVRKPGLPVCPPWQGDLLHQLITRNSLKSCLEIGFASGSTAIYMLNALASCRGMVTSIDIPTDPHLPEGINILKIAGMEDRHHLILENSTTALPKLYIEGKKFDLIFIDGWKTFDHLAVEVYFVARMLNTSGYLVFDDTRMPSVNKIISMLLGHYNYRKINLLHYNLNWRYRFFQILTSRNIFQQHARCFQKVISENDLPVTNDWNFYKDF